MSDELVLDLSCLRLELPHPSEKARDTAMRLATTSFSFDGGDELRPDEVGAATLNAEACRIASLDDKADCREAILEKLQMFVQLACDAQLMSLGFLQMAKHVDALSEQVHELKYLAEHRRKPR